MLQQESRKPRRKSRKGNIRSVIAFPSPSWWRDFYDRTARFTAVWWCQDEAVENARAEIMAWKRERRGMGIKETKGEISEKRKVEGKRRIERGKQRRRATEAKWRAIPHPTLREREARTPCPAFYRGGFIFIYRRYDFTAYIPLYSPRDSALRALAKEEWERCEKEHRGGRERVESNWVGGREWGWTATVDSLGMPRAFRDNCRS